MGDLPTRVRVTVSHIPGYIDVIRFKAGEHVFVGHHDQQWQDYVWCTTESGRSGWVPEEYLQMAGSGEARTLRDYDATELTVDVGEELEVLEEAGGWLRCREPEGIEGWIPQRSVAPI